MAENINETIESTETSVEVVKVKLPKPYKCEDRTFTEFNFDFSKLTGRDINNIIRAGRLNAADMINFRFDPRVLVRVAAFACQENVGPDVLEGLPANSYLRVTEAARNFMLNGD